MVNRPGYVILENFRGDQMAIELTKISKNSLKLWNNSTETQKSKQGPWMSKCGDWIRVNFENDFQVYLNLY